MIYKGSTSALSNTVTIHLLLPKDHHSTRQDCLPMWDSVSEALKRESMEISNHLKIPNPPWRKQIILQRPIWSVKRLLPAHKECLECHNVKLKPHIGEPLASSRAWTDVLGEARSITTLLWLARGAVCHRLAVQPQNTSQRRCNSWLNQREMCSSAPGEVWRWELSSTCCVVWPLYRHHLPSPSLPAPGEGLTTRTSQMQSLT